MNIVFWGGCINRQQNITAGKHYHAIVKHSVDMDTGITTGISLRFYSSFHELKCESETILGGDTDLDYMVVFIRPFTLMPLTRLLIRYTDKNMHHRVALHPRFSKVKYYHGLIKEYKVKAENNGSDGLMHKTFRRLNDMAGDVFNLPQWAQREVIGILENIRKLASQNGTQLVLVGPTLYPANKRISKNCIELNKKIALFASIHNIAHVDMAMPFDKNGHPLLEADGKHVTEAGHAFMAEGILKNLKINRLEFAVNLAE